MPQILKLEQQSADWFECRALHIGSSDAATILWTDPFGNSPYKLWQEKIGARRRSDWQGAASKKHGKDSEEEARNQAAMEIGDFFAPQVVECDRVGLNFMLASLDGMSHDERRILEVKCPLEIGTHLQAREGKLDDHYYAQVQHQLFVTEAEVCHFVSWFRGETARVDVTPDMAFWSNELVPAELEFWQWVETGTYPIPEGEVSLETPEALKIAEDRAEIIAMRRRLDDEDRKNKLALMRLAPRAKLLKVGNIELEWTFRKGYSEKKPRSVADSLSCTIRRVNG